MTIERPMFPPRAESVDSFRVPSVTQHPTPENLTSESRKSAEGLSRRHMLGALAVLPALPAAAAAAEPDPIFALIEAKRSADIAHLAALGLLNEASRRYGVGSDKEQAAYDAADGPSRAAFDAAWSLASTPPTTLAGVLAVLKFVHEIKDEGQWPEDMVLEDLLLETMLQAIDAIIRRQEA